MSSHNSESTVRKLLREAWEEIEKKEEIILGLRQRLQKFQRSGRREDNGEAKVQKQKRKKKRRGPYRPLSTEKLMTIHAKCVSGETLGLSERAFVAGRGLKKSQIQEMSETEFRQRFIEGGKWKGTHKDVPF